MGVTAKDSVDDTFVLSTEWLSARLFTFRAEPRGEVLTQELRFEKDGRISGCSHANETYWEVQDGKLHLLSDRRRTTCILTCRGSFKGRTTLAGHRMDPEQPGMIDDTIHFIEENPDLEDPRDKLRQEIMTFDLFDTLVARRCFWPVDVFRIVERKSGAQNFAKLRHEVEMRLFGRQTYGLEDIYIELGQETGWPPAVLQQLKIMELAEEWDNLFSIAATVSLVRPQDMIVSDMYLPFEFVRKIVEDKCGLKGVSIHLSNYGKHHSEVWPKLLSDFHISRHFGDNQHADVASPAKFGIKTEHVTLSSWSHAEKILFDIGLRGYSEAIRQTRLSVYDADPELRAAQQAQLCLNLPLLTVASFYVLGQAREWDADTLLMCARDCNLWEPLIRRLGRRSSHAPRVRYVRASRAAFYSGSPEYAVYFQRLLGERALLVDLVGTGQSPSHFLRSAQLQARVKPVVLATDPGLIDRSETQLMALMEQPFYPVRLLMEGLNMSLEGSAVGARFVDYALEVETRANEFSPSAQRLIAAMRQAFFAALALIEEMDDTRDPEIATKILREAAEAIIAESASHQLAIRPITDEILLHLKGT